MFQKQHLPSLLSSSLSLSLTLAQLSPLFYLPLSSLSSVSCRLFFCDTGVGISIFANKYPSICVAFCTSLDDAVNAHSINDCNVLYLSGISTHLDDRNTDMIHQLKVLINIRSDDHVNLYRSRIK